jgi:hypothetical protein
LFGPLIHDIIFSQEFYTRCSFMEDNKVAVLLEQLMSQFRTFGEGLDDLRFEVKEIKKDLSNFQDKMADFRTETNLNFRENKQEHQQIIQAIKETDTEVQQLKRIK